MQAPGSYTSVILLALCAIASAEPGITAIDPAKGEEVGAYSDGASTIPSACVSGGVLYLPSNGITALKPRADGNTPDQLWNSGRLQLATASPIVVGPRVYFSTKVQNSWGLVT